MRDMEIETYNPVTNIGGVFGVLGIYLAQIIIVGVIKGYINMISNKLCVNLG